MRSELMQEQHQQHMNVPEVKKDATPQPFYMADDTSSVNPANSEMEETLDNETFTQRLD